MSEQAVLQTDLPGIPCRRGKVRDVYTLEDRVLLVATDRISAFDVVMPSGIPGKGKLLTAISAFWFNHFKALVPHHLEYVVDDRAPEAVTGQIDLLRGRTMVCLKSEVVPIECVVRGYLAGSGWKDYQATGAVCGVSLPSGLQQCAKLPRPIFTPATKAESGHDENISFEQACAAVGRDTMSQLREMSLALYTQAAEYALARGVIIADTKFEFGVRDGRLILIDEVLTPDSSRFWPADQYEPGRDQESFDKQFVRNYLETLVAAGKWNKTPPGPMLPDDVIRGTLARYEQARAMLVG